jgi:hypothetical protein
MAAKKKPAKMEPLLSAVARTLGHAAGKLARATHHLTENPSEIRTATAGEPTVVGTRTASKRSGTGGRSAKPKTLRSTRLRPAPTQKAKKTMSVDKRSPAATGRKSTPHSRSLKRR